MALNLVECEQGSHQEQHLCALAERKQMVTLARLAKNGEYICAMCGRVAAKSDNICGPVELSQIA